MLLSSDCEEGESLDNEFQAYIIEETGFRSDCGDDPDEE